MGQQDNKPTQVNPQFEAAKKDLETAQRDRDNAVASRKAAEEKLAKLEKDNAHLRSLVQRLREDAPPELGDGAYLLTESVTFTSAKGVMTDGKVGDVVAISTDEKPADCDAVARKLGAGYRVHPVSPTTLDELQRRDMLRG